jgi:hypothetical protein
MSNSTGRASASRLALACYCCDRVLAAEARFHDPPLPGLLVADQLRRPPRSFVPVSAHGQGSLRYLPPSKRQSAPAPAKLAVLNCRAEGTCGHERSLAFDGDAERDRQIVDLRVKGKSEAEVCQILGCTVPDIHRDMAIGETSGIGRAISTLSERVLSRRRPHRVSLELNRSRQQEQRTRAQLSLKKVS